MQALLMEAAKPGGNPAIGYGPLVIGIIMVIGLIAAFAYGERRRRQEPPVPDGKRLRSGAWQTADENGKPCPEDHGPGHQDMHEKHVDYENVSRDAEDVEHVQPSERPTPHQLRHYPGPRTQ